MGSNFPKVKVLFPLGKSGFKAAARGGWGHISTIHGWEKRPGK